ncbi:MAG: HTH-type transcriptional regulator gltC [Conexibacter sp.]|nr:HTH-type transcriptional regulator gltC [Conexibacter sp.]
MELRQLQYFVAVAEEANFTRAAERVHISQSGVSAQIRQLERELGATLIDRSGRAATLTTAGVAVLEHARAALASAGAIRQAVDEVNGLVRGRLVIGMVTACTVVPLFDALAAFHRGHPGVEISLTEDNSDQLVERVRTGAIDLALIGAAGAPPAGLGALPIISEGLIAGVAPGHPMAGRKRAKLADLSAYPMVSLPQGTGIRAVFDQACAAEGIEADIALEASAPDAVADLAIRGLGIAILSASMASSYEGRLRAVALQDIQTPAVLALVWTATQSPALEELLVHCREAFFPAERAA